jgi:hypothetical protein
MEAVVMGVGCKRCRQLKQMTEDVLRELGAADVSVRAIDSLEAISQYGPMVLPALVVDGTLLVSGQVPTRAHLERLLRDRLQRQDHV